MRKKTGKEKINKIESSGDMLLFCLIVSRRYKGKFNIISKV